MGRTGWGALAFAAVACCLAAPARAQTPSVNDGIRHFRDLDDRGATAIFQDLLKHGPKAPVAAKCHLYLGLIALNALDAEHARAEFKQAIEIDPTVEPPRNASPKAWLIYNQVRTDAAQPLPPAAAPLPSVVVVENEAAKPPPAPGESAAPLEVSFDDAASNRPSHLPAYFIGGVGVAALIGGIALGVVSNSTLSSAKSAQYATDAENLGAQVGTDRLVADILFATALAGGATAVILFLTERSSSPVAAAVSPTPGGAQLSVEGRF